MKLFADDSSLFVRVTDVNDIQIMLETDSSLFVRVTDVNDIQIMLETDLKTISDWGCQWKMGFNPDITQSDAASSKSALIKSDF